MSATQVDLAHWVRTGAEVLLVLLLIRFALALVLALIARAVAGSAHALAHRCAQVALRLGPRTGRALIASIAGAGLLVAASGPATAALDQAAGPSPVLDRVVVDVEPTEATAATQSTESTAEAAVTVASGDTLWRIAGERLGPTATAAQIAASWPEWYRTNRDVIGDDPHRLVPGQLLRPPTTG